MDTLKRVLKKGERFYWGNGLADEAPALTYYVLISLAPFALGLAALAALIFGGEISPERVSQLVGEHLPFELRAPVSQLVLETKERSTVLLIVSVLAMMWTLSGAIGVLERLMSRILSARRYPAAVGKIRNVMLGGVLGLLVVASVAATTIASGLRNYLGLNNQDAAVLITAGNFIGLALFCAVIFRYSLRDGVRWRAAVLGALPAAIVFELAPLIVGWYFRSFTSTTTASIFVSLAVALAGCFVVSQGLLIGAAISALYQRRTDERSGRLEPRPQELARPSEPLTNGVVTVRPWKNKDATARARFIQDPAISRWLMVPEGITVSDMLRRAYQEEHDRQQGQALSLAIVSEEDKLLGCVNLRIAGTPSTVELSFWLGEPARGQGLMAQALGLVLPWCFATFNSYRIQALVHPENHAARAVLFQAGFIEEGVLHAYVDGDDGVMYALINPQHHAGAHTEAELLLASDAEQAAEQATVTPTPITDAKSSSAQHPPV